MTTCVISLGINNTTSAQGVEKGNIIINPYIGFPTGNAWLGNTANEVNFETKGLPISYGGRFEYMLADNFGLGLDVNYVISGYEYTLEDYQTNSTTGLSEDAVYSYTAKKLRAMARINYHFSKTDNLDLYIGLGAGYKSVSREFKVDIDDDYDESFSALVPIAVRAAFGGKYFFSDFIGGSFELGIGGGGIIQVGVAVKL